MLIRHREMVKNFRLIHSASTVIKRYKKSLALWGEDLNTDIKLKIENHWKENVTKQRKTKANKSSYYVLPMFPYPSGNLHMGHVRVYAISDTIARFKSMTGANVIHPMGWDAFGLPAENAALERNIPPEKWTNSNIAQMKEQLKELAFSFDWECEINTSQPDYYKWTQHIFLKLFENGLVYQNKAVVNWDPIDKTVLADEQVDDLGCSWRSGAKVEKKNLTQWFIKTTQYSKALYDGLDDPKLKSWKDIINLQKHWIGECNGVVVKFGLINNTQLKFIDIWTHEPHRFIHGEFITITSDNLLAPSVLDCPKGAPLKAYNPITEKHIPIYINDEVTYPQGRDSYLACPKSNEEDQALVDKVGFLSESIDNRIDTELDSQRAISLAKERKVGGYFVSSKLKDWLISRQRYWGTPIPIIHCDHCGTVPVPYKDLPVQLPENINLENGSCSLKNIESWVNCKCPNCGGSARRETDTMDTFVDSSWYYYRFLDPRNDTCPFGKEEVMGKTPVHVYIGGKEHAVLHLYYARFMSYFLHSLGWTQAPEPFQTLIVQGMVMGQSYKVESSGRYIPPENVEKVGEKYSEINTGKTVLVQWEKMSKSKYNGVNPKNLLRDYGIDTTRLFILADVPPATSRKWSDATFPGILNWQFRLWRSMRDFLAVRNNESLIDKELSSEEFSKYEEKIWESRNHHISTATFQLKHTHMISVGLSRLQELTNTLRANLPKQILAKSGEFETALGVLIIMLSPIAPHFCSELWAGFVSAPNRISPSHPLIQWDKSVLEQMWPKVDDHFGITMTCLINGSKFNLRVKASELDNLSQEQALEILLADPITKKKVEKGIRKANLQIYPGCRAILNVSTNRKVKQEPIENKI